MTDEEYVIILKNCVSMLADGIKYLKEEQQKQLKEAYERAIEAWNMRTTDDKTPPYTPYVDCGFGGE